MNTFTLPLKHLHVLFEYDNDRAVDLVYEYTSGGLYVGITLNDMDENAPWHWFKVDGDMVEFKLSKMDNVIIQGGGQAKQVQKEIEQKGLDAFRWYDDVDMSQHNPKDEALKQLYAVSVGYNVTVNIAGKKHTGQRGDMIKLLRESHLICGGVQVHLFIHN